MRQSVFKMSTPAAASGNNPTRLNHRCLYRRAQSEEAVVTAALVPVWRLCNLEAVILVYLTVLASENPGGKIKYYVPHKCKGLWGLNHFHLTTTGLLLHPRVSSVTFHSIFRTGNKNISLFSPLCLLNVLIFLVYFMFQGRTLLFIGRNQYGAVVNL